MARRIWALLDDRPGNRSQVEGVARAIAERAPEFGAPLEVELDYAAPAAFPNALCPGAGFRLTAASRRAIAGAARGGAPALTIAAGRRAAHAALFVKARFGAKIVQLMWPGFSRSLDLIATPEHDLRAPRAAGLMFTTGSPHSLRRAELDRAARVARARYARLPEPRIALLVGGSSKRARFGEDEARALGEAALRLAGDAGGSLMATTSRRTGAGPAAALQASLAAGSIPFDLHLWSPSGENPYAGLLGLADGVIVTADSASMVSEAAATGRAAFVFEPEGAPRDKLARLRDALAAQGRLFPIDAPYRALDLPPLDVAGDIARAALDLLK